MLRTVLYFISKNINRAISLLGEPLSTPVPIFIQEEHMMPLRCLPARLLLVLVIVLPVADAFFFRPLGRIVVHPSTTTNQSRMPGVKRGGGLPRPPGGLFKLFSGKSDNDTKKVLKNNKGKKQVESAPRKSNTFEGLIRKMVNKPDYKFGVSFFYKLVEFLGPIIVLFKTCT